METIGYLGPQGTYSQLAANAIDGVSQKIAYPSFPLLFSALKSGEVDGVVLPVENTLNGAVVQNLDLLQSAEDVWACRSVRVRVEHRLITLKGAPLSGIKRIFSHEQALGQCANYLFKNFRNAKLITTSSTAESVKMLKDVSDAAIAGSQCAAEGLQISAETVADEPNNYTTFLLVVGGTPQPNLHSGKIFFAVTCLHEAGALYKLLSVLAEDGINLTKIESRPIKDREGEFRFFIEIDGDYADDNMQKTLDRLRALSTSLKILGCY